MPADALLEQVYQLQENPFDPLFQAELQPRTEAERNRYYTRVDGFGTRVQEIEDWFKKPAHLSQPAFFLIHGPFGCGRSSVMHYLGQLFVEAVATNKLGTPVAVRTIVKDSDDVAPVQDILLQLYNHFLTHGVGFDGSYAALGNLYEQKVLGGDATLPVLGVVASQSQQLLTRDRSQAIVSLEGVEHYRQIETLRNTFKQAPLILVSTADQRIKNDVEQHGVANGLVITLNQLTFPDICKFIEERWAWATAAKAALLPAPPVPPVPQPFERAGLVKVFDEALTWDFRGVINLLTECFRRHIDELDEQLAAGGQLSGPARISAENMLAWVLQYERALRAPRIPGP